jgi:hypothetical protein
VCIQILLNKDNAPADVTDFERNELCEHNSKSGRNYAKAKLIFIFFTAEQLLEGKVNLQIKKLL